MAMSSQFPEPIKSIAPQSVVRGVIAPSCIARIDMARTPIARMDMARTSIARMDMARTSIARRGMALPCPLLTATIVLLSNLSIAFAARQTTPTTTPTNTSKSQPSKWTPENGWHGLVPGKDKLPKAISLLGKPTKINKKDQTYDFKNGLIEISLGDHNGNVNVIGRIVVQSQYPGEPKTEKEACKLYDPLDGSTRTKPDGFEYKRRGLSIYMQGRTDRKVTHLDFRDPKLDE